MDLDVYLSPTDHARAVLEVVLVILLTLFLVNEFVEMRAAFVKHGTVLPYFYELENWFDLAVYSILLSAAALWVRAYAVQAPQIDPSLSIDAYTNFFGVYGLLSMKSVEQARYEEFIHALRSVERTLQLYQTLVCLALFLMVLQLIAKLSFHPRLGVISRTITNAAYQLCFFFVLFFFVTIIFTVLGCTLFGFSFDEFGTLGDALESCLFVMLGDSLAYNEMIATAGLEVMTRLWYWLYVIIVIFVLMNALLAIIVEGYTNATAIDPCWREPLYRHLQIVFYRLQAKKDSSLFFSNEVLLSVLSSIEKDTDLVALSAGFTDVVSAYQKVNAAVPKESGAARMLKHIREQEYQLVVYGTRVSLLQLTKLLRMKGVADGLDEAVAINLMLRMGMPSEEIDDADLDKACKSR